MMHGVWKFYVNYEKEEQWINSMAAHGMALSGHSWCRYVFFDCEPGRYQYRIVLLKSLPSHPESMAYLGLLEESGIVCVATHLRWVYLRRESAAGAFDLSTDLTSPIARCRDVTTLWNAFAALEFFAAALNLVLGGRHLISDTGTPLWNFLLGFLFLALGCLFYSVGRSPRAKTKNLSKKQNVLE